MKSILFRNTITIQAPPESIYTYLMEPQNLPQLHPLIIDVKPLNSDSADSIRVEIQDRILLMGFIPFYKKYTASFTALEPTRCMLLETFTSPRIHIQNTISLSETDTGTLVEEQVKLEAPGLIAGFVMKQIEFSHKEMLASVKKTLETNKSG